jgi:DNA-binding PadR family transcriptional regulator
MRFNLHINQVKAVELGMKLNQAHIFDLLTTASTWCKPINKGKKVYYWVSRTVICDELPLLDLKPDTVYRHFKTLHKLGLIDHQKDGKKDLIRVTEKGKKYLSDTMSEINPKTSKKHYVGNKSEKDDSTMSEINPNKLGNKSENNSEINPTYHTTSIYPTTTLSNYAFSGKKIKLTHKDFEECRNQYQNINLIDELNQLDMELRQESKWFMPMHSKLRYRNKQAGERNETHQQNRNQSYADRTNAKVEELLSRGALSFE